MTTSFLQSVPGIKQFIKENKPYIFSLSFVITIVYSLYILIPFGTYDDYEIAWNYILSPQTAGMERLKFNVMDGRIFNGMMIWLFFKPGSISYFGVYRLINLFLLVVFSITLFYFLSKGISKFHAALLAIIICLLPSFSILFYFACLVGVITGGILSGLSVGLLNPFHSIDHFKFRALSRFFLSCLLLLAAAQFYQPIAMFYWVFVAIKLAFDRQAEIRSVITKYSVYVSVFILAMFFAWLLIQIAPGITGLPIKGRTAIIGIGDIYQKAKWFFDVPIHQSLNFFLLLHIPKSIVIITLVYISGGLYFWFNGSGINRVIKVILILTMIPFSYFPNLIVKENWASYRSMIALSAVWVVLIYFSSKGFISALSVWKSFLPTVGKYALTSWGMLAVVSSIYSSAAYIIIPAFIEHRFIHYQISEMQLSAGDTVYVSLANYDDGPSPYFYGDEFGIPATTYAWGAQNITNLVIREFGFATNQILVVTTDDPENVALNQPGNHLLDLRKMKELQLVNSMYPMERLKIVINSFFRNDL